MKALTVRVSKNGVRELQYIADYPKPKVGRRDVLIRVTYAGICGTDLELLKGYKYLRHQLVLGHEFVGLIAAFGDDCPHASERPFDLNDRVVAEINCVPIGCANASTARERAQHSKRTVVGIFDHDGAFAEYVAVPFENVHRVPDEIPDRTAVFTEPVAAACQILEEVHIASSYRVGVLGSGKLGWIVAKVLAAAGKDVSILTRRKAEDIPEYLCYWGSCGEHPLSVISISGNPACWAAFDVVIDCTGNPRGFETAIQLVKPRGTIVLKSTVSASESGHSIDLTPVVVKEIHIIGSRCGPFDVALRFMKNSLLDVESIITHTFPLEDGIAAVEEAKKPGTLKVLLVCS